MTLTLVLKKGLYPREYTCICEIWKLYHIPFKSYGQWKSFWGQANRKTDRPKAKCPNLSFLGHKKHVLIAISPFPSVFYPCVKLSAIFIKFKIVVCKLSLFGRVLNLSFGKGLTLYHTIPTFNDPG